MTNDIAFLGFCERAAYVPLSNTNIIKWNIIGLTNIVLTYVFPFNISGLIAGFAFRSKISDKELRFNITDENNSEVGTITINFFSFRNAPDAEESKQKQNGPLIRASEHGWMNTFLPLKDINIIISKPGIYYINHITDQGPQIIGEILFAVANPPPLSTERIAAIKSDPSAAKQVNIEIGCRKCPSKMRAYASLDRSVKNEAEGWQWYETIPDNFLCECGSTKIDLATIRRNLHGFLGSQLRQESEQLNFIPLYEKSSLERIKKEFLRLINSDLKEEFIQQFLYENPILLHQFPSDRLFSKPPILTFFNADFGIVTPQKELILIEIEKTTTRLLRKDGGIAAQLTHALDQVREWIHIVDEHRLAVLDTLQIERERVSLIRGVVIAGRDAGYDAQHIRRLKGTDWGRITILTYDDLLFAFNSLIRDIDKL
jgi:hypothetical protein